MTYVHVYMHYWLMGLRDWSLIKGRGGATKREGGGASEVLPLLKGGAEKVLAMLEWGRGSTKSFEVVLTRELEVLAIVMGGRKKFPPFKRRGVGAQKV